MCAALVTVFKRMRVDARGHCGVGVPCPGSYFRQSKSAQQNGNVLVSEVVESKAGETVVIARCRALSLTTLRAFSFRASVRFVGNA